MDYCSKKLNTLNMYKQDKNCKIMMKESKELNKRRKVPQTETGELHVVNMIILPKFIGLMNSQQNIIVL